jgi:hypothetical protein
MSEGVRSLLVGLVLMNMMAIPFWVSIYLDRKDLARMKAGAPLCSRCYAPRTAGKKCNRCSTRNEI